MLPATRSLLGEPAGGPPEKGFAAFGMFVVLGRAFAWRGSFDANNVGVRQKAYAQIFSVVRLSKRKQKLEGNKRTERELEVCYN